jgi:hypothetical protein
VDLESADRLFGDFERGKYVDDMWADEVSIELRVCIVIKVNAEV